MKNRPRLSKSLRVAYKLGLWGEMYNPYVLGTRLYDAFEAGKRLLPGFI